MSQKTINGNGGSQGNSTNPAQAFKSAKPISESEMNYLKQKFFSGVSQGVPLLVTHAITNGVDANSRDDHGNLPIMIAARNGYTWIAQYLIENGAYVNVMNDGETPLMAAANSGHTNLVRMLIEKGADVKIKDRHGFTALSRAITIGNLEMAQLLVERGAEVDDPSVVGITPFAFALSARKIDIARYLLQKGADTIKPDSKGVTPLMRAAVISPETSAQEMILAIISHGADVNAKDASGRTAYSYARENKCDSNAMLLRKHGAKRGILWW